MTAPCEPMPPGPSPDPAAEVAAWAASGAMWLTGPADAAPLGPPSGLVPKLRAIAAFLGDRAAALGGRLEVDPLAMLGHRAALAGLRRQGTTSCGGASRLLPARDGWLAVSLARPSDVELVPAWFEIAGHDLPATEIATEDVWSTVAAQVAASPVSPILERALLLGLPAAALPGTPPVPVVAPVPLAPLPVRATAVAADSGLIVDTARADGSAATPARVPDARPPASLAAIEPVQLLALEVAARALADAGYATRAFDRERASVIFGAEAGTDLSAAYGLRAALPGLLPPGAVEPGRLPDALDAHLPELTEDSFPGVLANVIAGRIANRLDLGGVNYTVDAACAASLAALDLACKELASGTSDLVLCGGADLHNGINDFLLFASVHALSP
ncbi:MAG: beta-ketoacyl synthase N-terminal-like domain-containing protein, partial [Acidimicrobiales bacterium]|nr:beta-ketoacyl synthase N-terminal-like domain-containing protein [Acidimicrobiales bacterium]